MKGNLFDQFDQIKMSSVILLLGKLKTSEFNFTHWHFFKFSWELNFATANFLVAKISSFKVKRQAEVIYTKKRLFSYTSRDITHWFRAVKRAQKRMRLTENIRPNQPDILSYLCDITQLAHDVKTTLYGRCNDFKTLKRRRNSVILTLWTGWII